MNDEKIEKYIKKIIDNKNNIELFLEDIEYLKKKFHETNESIYLYLINYILTNTNKHENTPIINTSQKKKHINEFLDILKI